MSVAHESENGEYTLTTRSHQDLDKYSLRKYSNHNIWYSFSSKLILFSSFLKAMIQKKIIQRSCRGPISITRVDPKGDFIVIENTCIKKVCELLFLIFKILFTFTCMKKRKSFFS